MRTKYPKNIAKKLSSHEEDVYLVYIRRDGISEWLNDYLDGLNEDRRLDDFQQEGFYIYAATCTKRGLDLFLETRRRELFVVVKLAKQKIRTDISVFQRFYNFWISYENYATRNRKKRGENESDIISVPFLSTYHESSFISMFMEGFEDLFFDKDYEIALRFCLATPRIFKPKFVYHLKSCGFYELLEFCTFLTYGVDMPPDATVTLDEIRVLFEYFGETISL